MADTGIFATTAEVQRKAGEGASIVSSTEAHINQYMTEAESEINSACRYNFSDNYATLNIDTRGVLKQTATNLAAIYVITYDMSGYSSRIEAEDMINILRDIALRNIKMLRDKKVSDFIREV